MRIVRLINGPASARAMIADARRSGKEDDLWVGLDVSAEPLLRASKLNFCRQDRLISEDVARSIDQAAFRISGEWYRHHRNPQSVSRLGLRCESFVRREFNFFVQGVLRAFYLLEALKESEGKCELVYTHQDPGPGIRLPRESSHLSYWIEAEPDRWGFSTREISFPRPPAGVTRRSFASTLLPMAARFAHPLARGGYCLFHGNPSLLEPVRAQLERRRIPCRRLRPVRGWNDLVKAAIAGDTPFLLSPDALGNAGRIDTFRPPALERDEPLTINGCSLAPVLSKRIAAFYWDRVVPLRAHADRLQGLFSRSRPSLVVLDEDVTELGSMIAETAESMDIPSLVVVHGIPGKPLGSVPSRARHIACWGMHDRDQLIRWGVDAQKITITGCPKYDSIRPATPETRIRRKLALGLPTDRPTVLIAPTSVPVNGLERFQGVISNPEERLRLLSNYLRIASTNNECHFLLKFHGKLDDETVLHNAMGIAGLADLPRNFKVYKTGSAEPLIQASDRVVSLYSSILLESLLMGVPVWVANFSQLPNIFTLDARPGAAWQIHTYQEAERACRELCDGSIRDRDLLLEQLGAFGKFLSHHGTASSRVADLAERLVRGDAVAS